MTLEGRLARLLVPSGAQSKRMFGGTCFLINGNMVIGTLKNGVIARVGKENHAAALRRPCAKVFDMTGRPMQGFIDVDGAAITTDTALQEWIDLALAYVTTLPPKADKAPAKKARR